MQCLPSFMITVTIVYTKEYTVASITKCYLQNFEIYLINIRFNSYTAIIISVQNIETEAQQHRKTEMGKNTGVRKWRKREGGGKICNECLLIRYLSNWCYKVLADMSPPKSHRTLHKCKIKCCSLGAHDSYLVYWDMTDCATHRPCNRTPLARVLEILP